MTPFMGVGSEVYVSVAQSRRAIGVELKPSYYSQAKRNLESGVADNWTDTTGQMNLLDEIDEEDDGESDS